jgi:hypothetical protein
VPGKSLAMRGTSKPPAIWKSDGQMKGRKSALFKNKVAQFFKISGSFGFKSIFFFRIKFLFFTHDLTHFFFPITRGILILLLA